MVLLTNLFMVIVLLYIPESNYHVFFTLNVYLKCVICQFCLNKTKNKKLLKELTRIPMAHPTRQKLLINSVILDLLIEILKTNPPVNNEIPHPLQLAIEKIRSPENINGGVSKFAELAGYSRMHLGRLIKQYYGKTPSALLHDIRMKLATEYLEKTSFTIEKIAEDVGFSSVSQFYAAFKMQYQCTPHTYRKKTQMSSLFLS